jgi:L-threonylcarbamoyladenylate synthase
MSANVAPTHTPALFDAAVQRAAQLLKAGEIVALPTETVYGLAANAFDPKAVEKIFKVKGRPAHNPIIVHVSSVAMAKQCASSWPALAQSLAAAFWPGPLTLVLPRSAGIPDSVTASGSTVGIRWSSHPLMQAVIAACGFPLAAPSANLSHSLSPTTAEHVKNSLGDKIKLIIDGGSSQIGIESTVLDLCESPPRVLRPGMIHADSLLAVTGSLSADSDGNRSVLRSPGQLPKHYAPKAKLVVWKWQDEADLRAQIQRLEFSVADVHLIAHTRIPLNPTLQNVSVIPHDAAAFARAIYAELHRCDEAGARLIVVEAPPETPEWNAIADRLNRASA